MTERILDTLSKWIIGLVILALGAIGGVASTNWAMHDTDRVRMGTIERIVDVHDVRLKALEQDRQLILANEVMIINNQQIILQKLGDVKK